MAVRHIDTLQNAAFMNRGRQTAAASAANSVARFSISGSRCQVPNHSLPPLPPP